MKQWLQKIFTKVKKVEMTNEIDYDVGLLPPGSTTRSNADCATDELIAHTSSKEDVVRISHLAGSSH